MISYLVISWLVEINWSPMIAWWGPLFTNDQVPMNVLIYKSRLIYSLISSDQLIYDDHSISNDQLYPTSRQRIAPQSRDVVGLRFFHVNFQSFGRHAHTVASYSSPVNNFRDYVLSGFCYCNLGNECWLLDCSNFPHAILPVGDLKRRILPIWTREK